MSKLEVRPLTQEFWRPAALLGRAIARELRSRAARPLKAQLRIFESDWLEDGEAFVLTDENRLAGYGWARDILWHGRARIHTGLYLAPAARTPDRYAPLTDALLDSAHRLGRRLGRDDAVTYYSSIDTIHPPVVRAIGFRDLPTTMIGFGHDLGRVPASPTPAGVEIRPGRYAEDAPLLIELGRRCFDDPETQGYPMDEGFWGFYSEELIAHPGQLLVALGGGRPVGYLVLSRSQGAGNALIAECAVDPAWRHRGIGSCLICRALDHCRRHRIRRVLLSEFSASPMSSALWRFGFRPDAVRTYYYFGRPLT
ncbi:MAG TPA: GNAT family N-acetyltransferase [candidate division WOR-3 bacterium]|uniref:GNAT family N-acetyltransferase n=1 Tax=candidate division WOR-3 bacterium TaxID=2052148 RepID=A0A7V0T7D1_UNCW3|nr:GNAT family N-acetyltransferase [candidate division WOR-3 bacterium]